MANSGVRDTVVFGSNSFLFFIKNAVQGALYSYTVYDIASLAQSVEQLTCNEQVVSSILTGGSQNRPGVLVEEFFHI